MTPIENESSSFSDRMSRRVLATCATYGFTDASGSVLSWLADKTDSQRALMAAAMVAQSARERFAPGRHIERVTDSHAAHAFQSSQRLIVRARRVMELAPANVIAMVASGDATLNLVERMLAEGIVSQRAEQPAATPPPAAPPPPAVKLAPPIPIASAKRPRGNTGARERTRNRLEAIDVRVKQLHEDGYGAAEIAKMLGEPRHTVNAAKTRLGLTARGDGPLAGLIRYAEEFADTWQFALSNESVFESASPDEREELIGCLRVLNARTRKLIARLNKEAKESETES